jgi:hypothetical protein
MILKTIFVPKLSPGLPPGYYELMLVIYSAATIPAALLLSLGAALLLLTMITPTQPPGELVSLDDFLVEEVSCSLSN